MSTFGWSTRPEVAGHRSRGSSASRQHAPDLASLSSGEAEGLGRAIGRLTRAPTEGTGEAGTYCVGFTEGARHAHPAIASRFPGLPADHVRLRFTDWPGALRGGRGETSDLARRLREATRGARKHGEGL